ncbi:hypothetical protein EVAR_99282_1 [Eumeta japonica]|uniref:Uncharacterized protein n=1 Tax=Eumeta variegata TaxID=151549 RepID=A0A4C1ZB33_EUMVA|nr:hypothetical protein EVAR_99282_1 [Eumeta japonica]
MCGVSRKRCNEGAAARRERCFFMSIESENRCVSVSVEGARGRRVRSMEDGFVSEVLALRERGDWRQVVDKYHDHPQRNKLLWVFPSPENFKFLHETMRRLACDKILSVGCGSGLLEWLIMESTGLDVVGVEVEGAWWGSRHAPPALAPRLLTDADSARRAPRVRRLLQESAATAILFCYFINGPAFTSYMAEFAGSVAVIVGPGPGKGVHADPKPFDELGRDWNLFDSQEVRRSNDHIAIYVKRTAAS